MKLKYKLPLILFIAFVVIAAGTFTVALTNSARLRKTSQYEMGKSIAMVKSQAVKSFMDIKVTELRALEKEALGFMHLDDKLKAELLGKVLYSFADQPAVSDAYFVFERGAYFSERLTDLGRHYNIEAFRPEKGGLEVFIEGSEEVAEDDDWYNVPKATGRLHLTEPYAWTYPGETAERQMITLSAPVFAGEKFIGAVGIDMELKLLAQELSEELRDDQAGSYAVLVSHEGVQVVHPDQKMLLVDIGHDMEEAEGDALKEAVKSCSSYQFVRTSSNTGDISLVSYVPMKPKGIDLPWSLGAVVSLSVVQAEGKRIQNNTIRVGFFCAAAWGVFLLIFMAAVFGNVTRTVDTLGKMTEGDGDLTIRLDERGRDEFGQMARGLNKLIEKLHSTLKTTQEQTRNLSGTATMLLGLAGDLSKSSEKTFEESERAAQKSEATSENVREIAAAAEKSSANATELSATSAEMGLSMGVMIKAVDEMTDSFGKITKDARESKSVAVEAIAKVTDAKGVMDALGASAMEIGEFTEVIKSIAKKTNLLALNATVEAARAGEAGKGFAVVANEVKQLANQSAGSAEDITRRIESIQEGTANAISVISGISAIMEKISEAVNSITESIERQTKVSGELSDSAQQTNSGATQVVTAVNDVASAIQTSAKNAGEAAEGAKNVSSSIATIQEDAKKTTAHSNDLKDAANTLKGMAEHLGSVVGKFKT
ncbi:MAG: methyl-accepting chemotaxis protein [Chitinispirillales bacterium]|jgi:methyl-accepting chemotaxis protein|nr:methyl-accepting chemotaxis protein [Chitinispirillales bacterium]